MGNTALQRLTQAVLTNKSGGDLNQGDTVIIDSANAAAFTTTTTVGFTDGLIGVVIEPNGIANNASGMVAFSGPVPKINLSGSASLGDLFHTHSVAGQSVRHSGAAVSGDFGIVLGTGTTPAAILWGFPVSSGTGTIGGATGSTDNAVIRADGTGGATIQSSLATIDDSGSMNVPAGQTYKVDNADIGKGRVLLSEQTPTGTGTVTFSSIPATYKSLEIEIIGRTDKAADVSGMYLYFNNDNTATNYNRQSTSAGITTVSTGNADNPDCLSLTGNNATASYPAINQVWIPQYAGTTFMKMAQVRLFTRISDATNKSTTNFQDLFWENTAAINRIDIVTDDSSNYVTGTTFRLYGVN